MTLIAFRPPWTGVRVVENLKTGVGAIEDRSPWDVDPTRLARLLQRVTYKPGWSFHIEPLGIEVILDTADSADPSHRIRVAHHRHMAPGSVHPGAWSDKDWLHWLFEEVIDIERHEAAEFFKVDGDAVFHPHRGEIE